MSRRLAITLSMLSLGLCGAIGSACGPIQLDALGGGGADLAIGPAVDLRVSFPPDGEVDPEDPRRRVVRIEPPFALSSGPDPDPAVRDDGLATDDNGWLGLDQGDARRDFLWIPNADDWGRGTVSKFDPRRVREVARYASVTCYSNPTGSAGACDGETGCCARDDEPRYRARLAGSRPPPHQSVQLFGDSPSRTGVDWNGDAWIANRAFGGQPSVTRIASDPASCIDRNHKPGVQTSRDENGDGVIDTDCNRNRVPDDLADVARLPCVAGHRQEYFGADDDCILFTTNTGPTGLVARALGLQNNPTPDEPSFAWAGRHGDGRFLRVDGRTGLIDDEARLPAGFSPYGAVVDAHGILWAVQSGAGLAAFDTGNPAAGSVRVRSDGESGYGIAIDRAQDVWIGKTDVHRYSPVRGGSLADLGAGKWTHVTTPGVLAGASGHGTGVVADARSAGAYFVWFADDAGYVVRVDASRIPRPLLADLTIDGAAAPAVRVDGSLGRGVGIDVAQNIWSIGNVEREGGQDTVITRVQVDANGRMTPPDLDIGVADLGCPIGSSGRCALGLRGVDMHLRGYPYSDFTGFGLRKFSRALGFYQTRIQSLCGAVTHWRRIRWDSDVPDMTSLELRYRTGPSVEPDDGWSPWSPWSPASPEILDVVEDRPPSYLQLEFVFKSEDPASTARLRSIAVEFDCEAIP